MNHLENFKKEYEFIGSITEFEKEFFENYENGCKEVKKAEDEVRAAVQKLEEVCEKYYLNSRIYICDVSFTYTPKEKEELTRIRMYYEYSRDNDGYWTNSYNQY